MKWKTSSQRYIEEVNRSRINNPWTKKFLWWPTEIEGHWCWLCTVEVQWHQRSLDMFGVLIKDYRIISNE